MRSKKRKIIKRIIYYILATLLFIIISTVAILWALGYRLDIKNYKLSKTGVLVIETNQPFFNLYLNDKKIFSPNKKMIIKNLLPRDYSLKIEKDGCYSWSKNLFIEPQKITREEKIILFPQKPLIEQIVNNTNNYEITSDQSFVITINNKKNELKKINLQDKKITNQIKLTNIDYFKTNFEGKKILIKQGSPENKFLIINLDENNAIQELSKETDNCSQLEWMPYNNQILFLIYNNSLYSANTNENPIIFNLLKPNVLTFNFFNNGIFYLQSEKEKLNLYKSDFSFKNPKKIAENLKYNSYRIYPSSDGQKIILKDSKEILYYLKEGKMEKINEGVKNINWNINNKKIVYNTDFEIWLLDFENGKFNKNLISRYSEKINNLNWYPDDNHLIFTLDDKINIIELTGTNLTEIASYKNIENQNIQVLLNKEKIIIFFLNKENNSGNNNLFSLKLDKYY